MSKLKNAPLSEVIFEIKWGEPSQKDLDLVLHFSKEEVDFMPGKFQLLAQDAGINFLKVFENRPSIPHLIKYRYSEKLGSYPLYQLGNGIFTINQIDTKEYEYVWDKFKEDVSKGIRIFEKCYPKPLQDLPLLNLQLTYQDVIEIEDNECIFSFIQKNLNVGEWKLPTSLTEDINIDTDCPSGSINFNVKCINPKGQIVCQINPGISNNKKVIIIDFIIFSKVNVFPEISSETLISWCSKAHEHQRNLFKAIFKSEIMETFQ